jgi:HlyD family secretion protein
MFRKVFIGFVMVVIAVGLIGLFTRNPRSAGTAVPTSGPVIQTSLQASAITAEGVIVPAAHAELSFTAGGRLRELAVQEGDVVETGQLLAQLESEDLEIAVRMAEENVALNQAQLSQAKAGPRAEDIAVAEAGLAVSEAGVRQADATLAGAQAGLTTLLAGPTQIELELARQEVDRAKDALWAAQAERDGVKGNKAMPDYAADAAEAAVLQAEVSVRVAELKYEQVKAGARDEEIAAARTEVEKAQGGLHAVQTQVAQAQAELVRAKAGPRPEDVAIGEVKVRQAEVALEEARLAQEQAQIFAPFGGTVVKIDVRPGESVAPNTPIITLADLSALRVETSDLDEWGVAQVRVGQPARITVNAFDDKTLVGTVTSIAARGERLPTGDVVFTVTIDLDQPDPDLRWEMTGKVEFQEE